MKIFYVDTGEDFVGLLKLDAETLEEAEEEIMDEWANSGKQTIIEIEYSEVSRKQHVVDTDWT